MSLRILIVEDNPDQAMTLKAILDQWCNQQFIAETVGSLKAALDRLMISNQASEQSGLILDGILLDLTLPDARDMSAVKSIATISPNVGIVILTGHDTDKAFEMRARQAGANALLTKGSADARDIILEIQYAIWQKRDQLQRYRVETTLEEIEQMRKRFLQGKED